MSRMKSIRNSLNFSGRVAATIGLATICGSSLLAAPKAKDSDHAKELVREALSREIYGLSGEREELLNKAIEASPDYAPAHWHRGYIFVDGEWIKAEDAPEHLKDDKRFASYKKVRESYPENAVGQYELAQWCSKRNLPDQTRAHLTKVLEFEPNHQQARQILGFIQLDGRWVHRSEISEELASQSESRENFAKWSGDMRKLVSNLNHSSQHKSNAAAEKIRAINDPSVVPALERILAPMNEASAMLAVEVLAKFNEAPATQALTRLSIVSPSAAVRSAAAKSLSDRDEMSYVPQMLASLHTPAVSQMQIARTSGGNLMYRHLFYREGQDRGEMMVLDTEYRRVGVNNGASQETLGRAIAGMREQALDRERSLAEQNQLTQMINSRVCDSLKNATGQALPAQPEAWWNWWNQHNGIFIPGQKPVFTARQEDRVNVSDRFTIQGKGGQEISIVPIRMPQDCLAAGSKIWTASGFQAVDKLKVGDMVLSQNPDTGELALKPVLRTTVRPVSTIYKIHAGDDVIECSAGHPFWVAGDGWVKARDIQPGMELHSVGGAVRISDVVETSEEQTFNLIIADFNTYFVGEAKVLSHDNTIRQPTLSIVPGLQQ